MEPAVNNAYSLGNSGKRWSTVVATALSGSLTKLADGTSFMVAGDNITITTGSNGSVTIASTASGGGGGDSAAQYLVLSATGSLSAERVFTAGTGIGVTDGGAGGNFTVAINNSVVATLSGSTFSGEIAGTSLSMSGNITGSNFLVNGTQIVATAPTSFNLGNTAATVNVGQSGTGNVLNVRGNLDVDGTADIAGTVTLSGNSQNVTHSGTGNLTIASTGGNVLIESTIFNGNDVTVPGNLTVNGTLVSIDTTNLRIKDPVVLIGSGSGAVDSKSAIAFGSGSAGGTNSLIVGSVGGGNVIAAAQQDVEAGALPAASLNFTNLVPFRASKFEIGGYNAYLTSSDGTSFILSGTSGTSKIGGVLGKGISFDASNAQLAVIKDSGSSTLFGSDGASATRGLILSGNDISLDYGGGGNAIQFNKQGLPFARMTWDSSLLNATLSAASPGANIVVGTTGAGITTVSGSTINAIYGSAGFGFSRDGTTAIKVLGSVTSPTIQAQQNNANLRITTNGGGSDSILLSGSALLINNGAQGVSVQRDGSSVLSIFGVSGSSSTIDNGVGVPTANLFGGGSTTALKIASGTLAKTEIGGLGGQTVIHSDIFLGTGNIIGAPGTGNNVLSLISSGNIVARLDANADLVGHKFIVQDSAGTSMFTAGEDGNAEVSGILVVSGSTLSTVSTTFSLLNTAATTINFAGAGTTVNIGSAAGSTIVKNNFVVTGSSTFGDADTDVAIFNALVSGSALLPWGDKQVDLGSPTHRWANMYTGDLHLRNERGNWTIIEESEFLTITNNLNGKRYKFVMEEL